MGLEMKKGNSAEMASLSVAAPGGNVRMTPLRFTDCTTRMYTALLQFAYPLQDFAAQILVKSVNFSSCYSKWHLHLKSSVVPLSDNDFCVSVHDNA